MTTLVNTLFPILLGVFMQYLFVLQPAAGPHPYRLEFHIGRKDWRHLAGFSWVFALDWVAAALLTTGNDLSDLAYGVGTIFTLVFLGLSMLSSIGWFHGAFRFLWLYHAVGLLVDMLWVALAVRNLPIISMPGIKILLPAGACLLYAVIKAVLAVAALNNRPPGGTDTARRIIFWATCLWRPAGLVLLVVQHPSLIDHIVKKI